MRCQRESIPQTQATTPVDTDTGQYHGFFIIHCHRVDVKSTVAGHLRAILLLATTLALISGLATVAVGASPTGTQFEAASQQAPSNNSTVQHQRTQREYANTTQEYRQTYERYERARDAGNTTAAREAARELEAQSERLSRLNSSLQSNYRTLTNQTGVDTGQTRSVVRNTTEEIATQQRRVRAATFVETRLTARTNESAVAFDDPSRISGRLTAANGTALADTSGRLVVADQSYRITTDTTGRFAVTYRPVRIGINTTRAPVSFRPANGSAYLGAASDVPVSVTQVTPRLDSSVRQSRGGYGDRFRTTVVATVDGRPVPELPVRVRLGDTVVSGRTDTAGRVTLSPQVPVDLAPGNRSLRAVQPQAGIAIARNATETGVTITERETELTVTATRADTVRVSGQLRTVAGTGVSGQQVRLSIGETTRTVETNATGWYAVADINGSAIDSGNADEVTVVATFEGGTTSLQDSRAETTVRLGSAGGDGTETPVVLVGMVFGVLLVTGAVGWSRRQRSGDSPATEATGTVTDGDDTTETQTVEWLDLARAQMTAEDSERAVVTAYGAVRRRLADEAALPATLTHREFVAAAESELGSTERGALSRLSTAYERVAFQSVSSGISASEAVAAAEQILSDDG